MTSPRPLRQRELDFGPLIEAGTSMPEAEPQRGMRLT